MIHGRFRLVFDCGAGTKKAFESEFPSSITDIYIFVISRVEESVETSKLGPDGFSVHATGSEHPKGGAIFFGSRGLVNKEATVKAAFTFAPGFSSGEFFQTTNSKDLGVGEGFEEVFDGVGFERDIVIEKQD
jgi:hypothetical protein